MFRKCFVSACVVLLAAACRAAPALPAPSPTPTADRPDVYVALVAAMPGPSESEATRAMQGARLALDLANEGPGLPVELVAESYPTGEDVEETKTIMNELTADPSVVAVIAWPGGADAPVVRADRGLAIVDLSPVSPPGSGPWSRLVATDVAQGKVMADLVTGRKACVAGDDGDRGSALVEIVSTQLRKRGIAVPVQDLVTAGLESYASLVLRLEAAGCHTLIWTGGAVEAAEILQKADGIRMIGSDRILNDGFSDLAGDLAEGAVATCPCGDIASSTDLEVQRFVQEYQSRYGTAPSAYAVEGWDAAHLVIDAIRENGTARSQVAAALTPPFDATGLLGPIRVSDDGEASPTVIVETSSGGVWTWKKSGDR